MATNDEKFRGAWRSLSMGVRPIEEMHERHLIHALRCCVRADARYTFDAERQKSFALLVLEAERRGLDRDEWLDHETTNSSHPLAQ